MKITYKRSAGLVPKSIEFCCRIMSHAVMRERTVIVGYYVDSYVEMSGSRLWYCPFCGRKMVFIKLEEPYEDPKSSPQ